jgi:hypothetical protein
MSFTSSAVAPASFVAKSTGNLIRGGTTSIPAMARAVGVVLTASVLAAGYQIAVDEAYSLTVCAAHLRCDAPATMRRCFS